MFFICSFQFDSGQEINLEADMARYCGQGSGPIFSWTIWDEDDLLVAQFDTVTLLLRPSDSASLFGRSSYANKMIGESQSGPEQSADVSTMPSRQKSPSKSFQYEDLIAIFKAMTVYDSYPPDLREHWKKDELRKEALEVSRSHDDRLYLNRSESVKIGSYTAVFQIVENNTVVHNEKNAFFKVVEVPFR